MSGRLQLVRRWFPLFAVAILVASGCLVLASWQWHRREARLAANHLVETNYDRTPIALDAALATDATRLPHSATWTPVEVHGEYISSATTLVRNRPLQGQAGFSVLVPLLTDDGRVLVVNRGYLPTGETGERPDSVPDPPTGQVVVVARLQPPETPRDQQAPTGQTYRITPSDLAGDLATRSQGSFSADQVVTGGYVLLADERPTVAEAPRPLPEPPLDEGPHLSYSIQWVIFAIGAVAGVVIVVRRTLEDERAAAELPDADISVEPTAPERISRRGRTRVSDEEIEDALLDAAEASRRRP